MNVLRKIVLVLPALYLANIANAQQDDRDLGIELYNRGDLAGAITKLSTSTDPTALHYLGQAFEKTGKPRDAAKAFEQSFKTGFGIVDQKLADRLDRRITTAKENFTTFLKGLRPIIEISFASAENAVRLKAKMAEQNEWLWKANSLLSIGKLIDSEETIFVPDEVDTEMKLTRRPRPAYTDDARTANTQGTVTLLVVFRSDGTVNIAIPLNPLPHGLTNEAIIAAKRITFEPAIKNGKPVSVIGKFEYTFSVG